MLEVTDTGRKERRPACATCGGSGYVYLWSVERVRGRTFFCDRCKLSWLEASTRATPVIAGATVEAAVALPRRGDVAVAEAA